MVATVAALVVVLVAGLGAVVLEAVVGAPDQTSPGASVSAAPEPTSAGDLTALRVPRQGFCDRLDRADVTAALRGPVATTAHYDSGEVAALEPGLRERAHEFGCSFRGLDGTRARAWVFAGPVSVAGATALTRAALARPGCRRIAGAPAYGRPSVATSCPQGAGRELTLSGAFGSTWLTCRLSLPRAGLATVPRAERWCTTVATALATG